MNKVRCGLVAGFAILGFASSAIAQVEPLKASVSLNDARRFAEVWYATNGKPGAEDLQTGYLDGAGRGVEVFTRGRIENAQWLSKTITENPELYRDAVERCLPWVEPTSAQLRSTYLGFKGLLPEASLPEIAVVFGANNSGGTAAQDIQVIGLEVVCRQSPNRAAFENRMRKFFAHETVHTFQSGFTESALEAPLLAWALREGVPDYLTLLITADMPHPDRHSWAQEREEWVWQEFLKDAEIVRLGMNDEGELTAGAQAAYQRWFANAGDAPEGWPDELGYWVGMRIAESYVNSSSDPAQAIRELINPDDPISILQKSHYGLHSTSK